MRGFAYSLAESEVDVCHLDTIVNGRVRYRVSLEGRGMTSLRNAREAKSWSRAELARRSGLNQVTIGQIETRRLLPYPSQLKKLARALRVRIGELEVDDKAEAVRGQRRQQTVTR